MNDRRHPTQRAQDTEEAMTQPNDAIVERVARAIAAESHAVNVETDWPFFIDMARAALEAAGSESTPIVAETEARIVEWLREMAAMPADAGFNSAGKTRSQILTMLADAIARRDHVTGEKDRGNG